MKTRLTFRYIIMVMLSTFLLIGLTFLVLTGFENSMNKELQPGSFAHNFVSEIQTDEEDEIFLTEQGQNKLLEQDAWIQLLNKEGYVMDAFNTPSYVAYHYSPDEMVNLNISSSNPDTVFYTVKINEELSYLMALPSENWHKVFLEFDNQFIVQFFQTMLVIAIVIFVVMGYIFSRRIANPVTEVITGVEELAENNYKVNYQEKGLYGTVFASLNQLAVRLKASDFEREKTKEQREKWISNISHDLKTPLSSIKGYSEILSDPNYAFAPNEIRQYSITIHEKSIYMENLIEELRLNERLMHNSVALNKASRNLTAFMREIIIDILNHPDFRDREIVFHTTHKKIPYSFDKDLFKRSIENLIYNALIHNDETTKVVVNLMCNHNQIIIEINDDGQGMNTEELNHLFNRYYRGSNTKNHKGTGLGMSIAKEVIEAHEGKISVQSKVNSGTHITIIL